MSEPVVPPTRSRWAIGPAAVTVVLFVAALWVIEIVDTVLMNRLDAGGITPWRVDGAGGILWAPLLHSGWPHLIANTVPALVLGFLALAVDYRRGVAATAIIWFGAGAAVWFTGGLSTLHLGASGLIFGWLTYVILRGLFNRRIGQLLIGVAVGAVYGGLLWGVLPTQPGVSWQSHLFGAVAGALAAVWLRDRRD
ncbi:rhomboid family intramembrane serine protease [Microbacterium sp.]|uniref:rhomboid family intramembrane serine protease n=1 Tax=Microbacterium sp. TaxID=51671 RepID=UPI002812700C|nr:rhomboid family intramembrane serine protease [Microbacterium sp.]